MTPSAAPPDAPTYASYLALEEVLGAQRPRSDEPDELLFIIVHQAHELWFKELLHEFARLQASLEANDSPRAVRTVHRVLTVLRLVIAQMGVLETMTPREFGRMRSLLGAASGFQSAQFRELEAVLGRRDPAPAAAYPDGSTERRRIVDAMSRPSLFDSFLRYLVAHGYPVPDDVLHRDVREPARPSPELRRVIARAYADDGACSEAAERLLDVDEAFQEWRYRHVKLVERTIGATVGTGGSAGAAYLRGTLFAPMFPDLWAGRGEL